MNEVKRSRIAQLVEKRVEELKGVKLQKEIAREVGWSNQNFVSMVKTGESKVALDRVGALAKALEVDPVMLMRLAMEQFYDQATLDLIYNDQASLTDDEIALIAMLRNAGVSASLTEDKRKRIYSILAA